MGFFARLFRKAASPAPAPPQQSSTPLTPLTKPAPAPAPEPVSSNGSPPANASSELADGASSLIASSLKFTGMAARVALGMAANLKADATKALRQMEEEAEQKRARKLAEQAFLRMLRSKDPPMAIGTTFSEVEQAFGGDARFLVRAALDAIGPVPLS